LAVIPKSIIQTSPGLTTGIVILHAIEHHRAIECRLVAEFNVLILGGEFEQALTDQPPFSFGELGQFIDDFRGTHGENLVCSNRLVRLKLHRRVSAVF